MILTAAIMNNGVPVTLPRPNRHHDIIKHLCTNTDAPWPIKGEQGFIDDKEGFVDRKRALSIAVECGQVLEPHIVCGVRLYSEDLW